MEMRYLVASTLLLLLVSGCNIRERASERSARAAHVPDVPDVSGVPLTLCGCGYVDDPSFMTATPNSLIFGDATTAISALREALEGLGHTVTVSSILPDAPLTYSTIWHVGNIVPLTPDERARLVDYVQSGGGLHLTGERLSGDDMNGSLELLVGELVAGGGVQVGRLGDVFPPDTLFGPYPINPGMLGNIAYQPNAVSRMRMKTPGGLAGIVESRNILASGRGDVPVGALWDSDDLICGSGALSIVMDNGWFELIPFDGIDNHNAALLENLQAFLHSQPRVCLDSDGDGVPDDQDACPETPAESPYGQIVDEEGCGIDDLCPCDASWKNHGEYTSCVSNAADELLAAGLIEEAERLRITSQAAGSRCGVKG